MSAPGGGTPAGSGGRGTPSGSGGRGSPAGSGGGGTPGASGGRGSPATTPGGPGKPAVDGRGAPRSSSSSGTGSESDGGRRTDPGRRGPRDDGGDYDPHQHRNKELATNNLMTLMHLVKAALGTGVMALPQSMGSTGVATAAIAMVVSTGALTHCLHAAVRARRAACARRRVPLLTYPQAVEEALRAGPPRVRPLARAVGTSVTLFINLFQLGTPCVYIVFMATTLRKLIGEQHSVLVYMAALVGPLVLFSLIPSLKALAPFSALANASILAGLGIVMYFVLTQEGAVASQRALNVWGSPAELPACLGTALFALWSVGVVLQIENNMANPQDFGTPCGLLNQSAVIVLALYLVFGVCGYVLYCGDACQDTITLNLPHGPLPRVVNALLALAMFISYVLHIFQPLESIWLAVRGRCVRQDAGYFTECVVRVIVVLCTFVVAAAVPKLGLFISLLGALCMSALGIVYPMIMQACFLYPYTAAGVRWQLLKIGVLAAFGLMTLVTGTLSAFVDIIDSFL